MGGGGGRNVQKIYTHEGILLITVPLNYLGPYMIGLTGGSASGKSSVGKRLQVGLNIFLFMLI